MQRLPKMLTDGRTDWRTSSIHKPELLCNQAKNWLTKKTFWKYNIHLKDTIIVMDFICFILLTILLISKYLNRYMFHLLDVDVLSDFLCSLFTYNTQKVTFLYRYNLCQTNNNGTINAIPTSTSVVFNHVNVQSQLCHMHSILTFPSQKN